MSRYPDAQTHQRTHHLTQLMPRRQGRGSADAGFLRRTDGTAPLLPTKPGRQAEARLALPHHCKLLRLLQLGLSEMWNEINPMRGPKHAGLQARGGQGERYMNDAVHPKVHRSVHLAGERKSRETLRLRGTRRLILDAGKTPDWAGATPLSLPRKPWRSLQPRQL